MCQPHVGKLSRKELLRRYRGLETSGREGTRASQRHSTDLTQSSGGRSDSMHEDADCGDGSVTATDLQAIQKAIAGAGLFGQVVIYLHEGQIDKIDVLQRTRMDRTFEKSVD